MHSNGNPGGGGLGSSALVTTMTAMVREGEIRRGEQAVQWPEAGDAGLVFIGRIRTPWTSRLETPRQGRLDGPVCRIELFAPWVPALAGLDRFERVEVLYWLHLSRRDLVLQSLADDGPAPAPSPCARLSAPTRSAPRSRSWWGSGAIRSWPGGWTASTARRSSTSSPTAAGSRRWPRRSRATLRRGTVAEV